MHDFKGVGCVFCTAVSSAVGSMARIINTLWENDKVHKPSYHPKFKRFTGRLRQVINIQSIKCVCVTSSCVKSILSQNEASYRSKSYRKVYVIENKFLTNFSCLLEIF